MLGQEDRQGCAPTRTTIVVLAVALLWMMLAPKIIDRFWGTPQKPAMTEEEKRDAQRKEYAEVLRKQAKVLREQGLEKEAMEAERLADRIEAGKAGELPPGYAATPERAGEATRRAAEDIAGAVGPPGTDAAAAAARAAERLPGVPKAGPGEPPKELPPPEEPEADPAIIGPVETDELSIEFNTLGASVERASLVNHHLSPGEDEPPLDVLLPIGGLGGASNSFVLRPREGSTVAVDLSRRVWDLAEDTKSFDSKGERKLVFRRRIGSVEFVKTYTLRESGFVFDVDVEVRNAGASQAAGLAFDMIAMNGIAPDARPGRYWNLQATLAGRKSQGAGVSTRKLAAAKLHRSGVEGLENFQDRAYSPSVKEWLALTNHYFAAVCQVVDSDGVEAMYAEPVVFESKVRYVLADIQVGERLSAYRKNASDLVVHEALRRWDAGVRVTNADRFEPGLRQNTDVVFRKGTKTLITGGGVALSTDGTSKFGRDFSGDPILGLANLAAAVKLDIGTLAPKESKTFRFRTYLGPLHTGTLAQAGGEADWESLVSFGWFGWLSKLLLLLLNGLHFFTKFLGQTIGGYGLAIFFLTLAVKGALHPLQRKAMVSMHKMQALAPEMKAIKKRYEKDKSREGQRKMQLEIMELYKKHGVSPLGGCFPMLVQMPMFFALFGMLRGAFDLRHQGYLWISDLTSPDRLITFTPFKLPLLGWEVNALNLLPIAYIGLMLLQQRLAPKSEDPQVRQQQGMMKYMMIFFGIIFYGMPSGLVLYFVFSNGIGILEQWHIRKNIIPAATGGGGGPVKGASDEAFRSPAPKTAWEKAEEKAKRKAEKRKNRRDRPRPLT